MRKKRRLRVFDNTVLRRIFQLKRDEVTGEWRRRHNEELNSYPANVDNMVAPTNASKWRMGFNSAFTGLMICNPHEILFGRSNKKLDGQGM